MLNRKIQVTLLAAFAAVGLAFAPATALAKSGDQYGNSQKSSQSSNGGNQGTKSVKHDGPKHDNGKHDGGKHDKHEKWKHKDHDHAHNKHWHHKHWHYKKHYEEPSYTYTKPTYNYVKPTYAYTKPTYSPPASSTCTCLTKEYTSDGSVVFKDICTKEMAVYNKDD